MRLARRFVPVVPFLDGQSFLISGSRAKAVLSERGTPGDDESGKLNCGAVYVMSLSSAGVASSTTRLVGNPAFASGALGTSVAIDGAGEPVAA